MMSKIQNLNGTHNNWTFWKNERKVVYDVKDTKFEWNSQPSDTDSLCTIVVYDVKDTKFEWNSQHKFFKWITFFSCLWCQRYKIWMELTTRAVSSRDAPLLFMMSKIQNLNGTHNPNSIHTDFIRVVYDVKDTKFEWNSQRVRSCLFLEFRCLWCQRYKIWMELTTVAI